MKKCEECKYLERYQNIRNADEVLLICTGDNEKGAFGEILLTEVRHFDASECLLFLPNVIAQGARTTEP